MCKILNLLTAINKVDIEKRKLETFVITNIIFAITSFLALWNWPREVKNERNDLKFGMLTYHMKVFKTLLILKNFKDQNPKWEKSRCSWNK